MEVEQFLKLEFTSDGMLGFLSPAPVIVHIYF